MIKMEKNKVKVIAGVLLVFFLGILIGSLGTGICIRHRVEKFAKGGPPEKRALSMRKLTSRLKLTPQQQTEIEKIVDSAFTQLHELRQKHRPEVEAIIDGHVAQIKEKLNEAQKQKMDQIHEKLKKRWLRGKFRKSRHKGKAWHEERCPP